MIPYSNTFLAALDEQIRPAGRCYIHFLFLADQTEYVVPEELIQSVNTVTSGDPLSRELPTEACDVVLIDYDQIWNPDNLAGLYAKMDGGALVTIRFGIETDPEDPDVVEWGPDLKYYTMSQPSWSSYVVTFSATRALGLMSMPFRRFSGSVNNLELLTDAILTEADRPDVIQTPGYVDFSRRLSHIPVIDHTDLRGYTAADALLAVCVAGMCCVRTSYAGDIVLADYYGTGPQVVEEVVKSDDMMEYPVSDRLPLVRDEVVSVLSNPESAGSTETLLEISVANNIPASALFELTMSCVPGTVTVSITNAEPGYSVSVYRGWIEVAGLVLSDPTSPAIITATGKPQRMSETVQTHGINHSPGVEDEEVSNPLINDDNWNDIAQYRGGYLSNTRSKYSINYRGNPSFEPYDLVRIELPFLGFQTCIVLESQFTFAEGFSGTLLVRRLDTLRNDQKTHIAVSDLAVSDDSISDSYS